MFTNIPEDLVITVIKERWNSINLYTKIPLDLFLEGILLIYRNCFFTYENVTYQQIFGTPMGSPLSPPLADLVMEFIEESVLKELRRNNIHVIGYKRYVDDTFLAVSGRNIKRVLDEFNKQHKRLNFTIEEETENGIPFLDLMVKNVDGILRTRWYHKPTWSGRYLNYNSQIQSSYKRNTISLLTRKVLELSDTEFQEKDLKLVKTTLYKNGYPSTMIKDVMQSTIKKLQSAEDNKISFGPDQRFVCLPYYPSLFQKISKIVRPYNIIAVSGPAESTSVLFTNLKDSVPKSFSSNLVYELTCNCSLKYIGQTKQHLITRFLQHKNGDEHHSSMSAHIKRDGCDIDFENMQVICKENKQRVRDVKESLYIKTTNNINIQSETVVIGTQYDNIIM